MKVEFRKVQGDYYHVDIQCDCTSSIFKNIYITYGSTFTCPQCGKVLDFIQDPDGGSLRWYVIRESK